MDSDENDLFRAKYGYFYADYSGRPSELVNIGPQLVRSATRKGAPTTLPSKTVSRRSGSWSSAVDSVLNADPEDDSAAPLTSDSARGPQPGTETPGREESDSVTIRPVAVCPPTAVIEIVEHEKRVVQATVTETRDVTSASAEQPLETAPGKAPGKLTRLQSVRSVHRVGRVGPAAHLRPGWKMIYFLVVVSIFLGFKGLRVEGFGVLGLEP